MDLVTIGILALPVVGFALGWIVGWHRRLEVLKKKGTWMTPRQMKLIAPDRQYPYGYLVFIPDAAEKEGKS